MSSRVGEHIFYTLMRTGLAYRHNDMGISKNYASHEKVRPAAPFHRKTGLFSLVIAIRLE